MDDRVYIPGWGDLQIDRLRARKHEVSEENGNLELEILRLQSRPAADTDDEDRKELKDKKEQKEQFDRELELAEAHLTLYEAKMDPRSDQALIKGFETRVKDAKENLLTYIKQRLGDTT